MTKRTNIELDVDLVARAMKATNLKTIKDVVHYSLEEIVRTNLRKQMLGLKGKVRWVGDLDTMRSL